MAGWGAGTGLALAYEEEEVTRRGGGEKPCDSGGSITGGALPLLVLIGLASRISSPPWGVYVGLIVAGLLVLRAATAGLKGFSGERLIYRGVSIG